MPEMTARRSYAHAPRLPDAPQYDLRSLFAEQSPAVAVELEIGCARGGFLLERLETDACVHAVGFEINLKAATVAAQKLEQRGLASRGRVFAADARSILPKLSSCSIRRVFLHFPDPWWKKRHAKRRLASEQVQSEIERILEPQGELYIQTDVEQLAEAFIAELGRAKSMAPVSGDPRVAENPFGARSPREKQATLDGLPIFRLWYRKRA